jgi:hypothetical protein
LETGARVRRRFQQTRTIFGFPIVRLTHLLC